MARLPLVSPAPTGPARRVVLVAFDWHRAKDPRTPLGHASILASLERAGVDVRSLVFHRNDPEFDVGRCLAEVRAATRGAGPVDVAVGVYVWNERVVQQLLRGLRAGGFTGRVVLGGPQVSYVGPGLERLYPDADLFVRGAAEQALTALALGHDPRAIPGVHAAGDADREVHAEVELGRLASPWLSGACEVPEGGFVRWETARGCTYSCSFCQHREPGARQRTRPFPLDRLRDELRLFAAKGVRDVAVLDPVFNLGSHPLEVLRLVRESGLRARLSLQCHFETLTPEFLDACEGLDVRLEFGLQSVQRAEMRAVQRVNRLDRVEHGIAELNRRGIAFEVSLIYGLPEQTLESFRANVDYCRERGVPVLRAYPLALLRGTPLERDRARWGFVETDDEIPLVCASNSFDERDWRQMRALAEGLEGCAWEEGLRGAAPAQGTGGQDQVGKDFFA